MAIIPAFQADDMGSIPITRSILKLKIAKTLLLRQKLFLLYLVLVFPTKLNASLFCGGPIHNTQ